MSLIRTVLFGLFAWMVARFVRGIFRVGAPPREGSAETGGKRLDPRNAVDASWEEVEEEED
ncbi:MAG: hypothetical protein QGH59_00880 [Gemmatimonadota bacterium]|nr:hypothetical protein [Gemmatimonadota bacterium]